MSAISEFESVVDAIYGVYLDSTTGFAKLREWLERQQKDSLRWLKDAHPELATTEYLDSTRFIYGKGDPSTSEAVELHRCTQRQYKERNADGGLNFVFSGRMALVSLYQFWEDHFRAEVATLLKVTKDDLKEPIMGDIRLLRRSIIHHAGIALPDVERCEILRWFREGDEIYIDKERFRTVMFEIKKMIAGVRRRADGA